LFAKHTKIEMWKTEINIQEVYDINLQEKDLKQKVKENDRLARESKAITAAALCLASSPSYVM
jgi:hypothetical protein